MRRDSAAENFTFGQVAKFSGIKPRTLDHWAATGFFVPSVKKAVGTGTRRLYSFSDIVSARFVKDLRSAGVSPHSLRRVVKQLRKWDFSQPIYENRLVVSGNEVYLQHNESLIATLQRPGQTHFPLTVLDVAETVRAVRVQAISARVSERRHPRQLPLEFSHDSGAQTTALSTGFEAEQDKSIAEPNAAGEAMRKPLKTSADRPNGRSRRSA